VLHKLGGACTLSCVRTHSLTLIHSLTVSYNLLWLRLQLYAHTHSLTRTLSRFFFHSLMAVLYMKGGSNCIFTHSLLHPHSHSLSHSHSLVIALHETNAKSIPARPWLQKTTHRIFHSMVPHRPRLRLEFQVEPYIYITITREQECECVWATHRGDQT